MNSEVVKNFTLEIKIHESKEFGDVAYREYLFTCRNCSKEFSIPYDIEPSKLEFDLSLHLMQCFNYPPEENE
jgi:hypothetical protein